MNIFKIVQVTKFIALLTYMLMALQTQEKPLAVAAYNLP
jgi:hypothetical protein